MPDTFTHIASDIEDEGNDGITKEIREAGEKAHAAYLNKLKVGGCKSMESVADAVGFIRGLEFFLNYTKEKSRTAQVELADEENGNWRDI